MHVWCNDGAAPERARVITIDLSMRDAHLATMQKQHLEAQHHQYKRKVFTIPSFLERARIKLP